MLREKFMVIQLRKMNVELFRNSFKHKGLSRLRSLQIARVQNVRLIILIYSAFFALNISSILDILVLIVHEAKWISNKSDQKHTHELLRKLK